MQRQEMCKALTGARGARLSEHPHMVVVFMGVIPSPWRVSVFSFFVS